jgi:hypothetical protein
MGQENNEDKPPEPPPPTRLQVALAKLKALPGAGFVFALIPLLLIGYFGWYHWGAEHLDRALYALRMENVELTPQPGWLRTDVREEVFRNGALEQVSLLDPQATATIAHAFDAHACVKTTVRVRKAGRGKVQVDLLYRMPAAMVYYERPTQSDGGLALISKGCFPIDDEGVVLPTTEFTREQVFEYFLIFAAGTAPKGDVGMAFGDPRIMEALDLTKLLAPLRVPLKLERIYVEQDPVVGSPSPWVLRIVTKDRREVITWGHAPGKEISGEPRPEAKLAALQKWFQTLPSILPADGKPAEVDLRQISTPAGQFTSSLAP